MDKIVRLPEFSHKFESVLLNELIRIARLRLDVHTYDIEQPAGDVAFGRAALTAEQVEKFVFHASGIAGALYVVI